TMVNPGRGKTLSPFASTKPFTSLNLRTLDQSRLAVVGFSTHHIVRCDIPERQSKKITPFPSELTYNCHCMRIEVTRCQPARPHRREWREKKWEYQAERRPDSQGLGAQEGYPLDTSLSDLPYSTRSQSE